MSVLQIFRGDEFLEEVVLSRAVMGLGRHPQNDVVLDDRSLSRFHARVERRGDRFVVVDCGAQNGVHLNGERVIGESDLAPGDRITLGRYIAVFDSVGRAEPGPKYDLNRALPNNGSSSGNGKHAPKASSLDAELEALDIGVDVDVEVGLDDDGDIDVDDNDDDNRTQKAKHKEIIEKELVDNKTTKKKPEPTLVLLFNGMEVSRHPVPTDGLTIGRSKQSDVVISLLGLSRKHAQIRRVKGGRDGDSITVEDLGSQNGTWVNNARIQGQKKLKHGDLMNFYDYAVLFLEDGDVDVGFPGGTFPQPGDTDAAGADELEKRETNRTAPAPTAPARRPPTARSPVPLADSHHSSPAHGAAHKNGHHNGNGHHHPAAAHKAGEMSASELVDLGEGSFLGEEFEEEAKAKKGEASSSSLLDEEILDDIGLDEGGTSGKTNATDVVNDLDLGSDFKNHDEAGGFDGMSGTEGDQARFDDKTSASMPGAGRSWATDAQVLKALSNSPDGVIVTLEVVMGGKPYTQMPLSQTVTRVGTDARCEMPLPKTSGLMPWHLTLMHLGGTVVLYRAARAGKIQLAEADIDMAIIQDGDMLDLGKVKLKIRMK